MQAAGIDDDEQFDPDLLDDFESDPYFWDEPGGTTITERRSLFADARPGQDADERRGELPRR